MRVYISSGLCMIKRILLITMFLLTHISMSAKIDYQTIIDTYHPKNSEGLIYIDKQELTLCLYDSLGILVKEYPIACGKNLGHKKKEGDCKTPEGSFIISQIQNSKRWGHDFHDGKGFIKYAYGPWFIRLKTGFNGIGIHGTHDPESIGTRATEGCIRLNNEDLNELKSLVQLGMPVLIGKDSIQ